MFAIFTQPMFASSFNLAAPDLLIACLALVLFFVVPALLQLLWNTTIPQVFGLRTITFWQSFRLLLICGILFGRFSR
jgi:hypothetical protein